MDQGEKKEKKTIEKQGVGEGLILGEGAAEGGGGEEGQRSKELEKISGEGAAEGEGGEDEPGDGDPAAPLPGWPRPEDWPGL